MSHKKCFFGCVGKLHLFKFPNETTAGQQWMEFVFGNQTQSCSNVFVCDRHFTDDCWLNKGQYDGGFANKLLLKQGSVPSVKENRVSDPEPHASTSGLPCGQETKKYADCGCQTEPPHTVSVASQHSVAKKSVGTQCSNLALFTSTATQLSLGTLRAHVRSKGSQATAVTASVGTETEHMDISEQFSSTPVKASTSGIRPAKRLRIELEEEEGDDDGADTSFLSTTFQSKDTTYIPGDSVTETSELSGMESTSDYGDAKYIVFESSLKGLFEKCPVCKHPCEVQRRRLGTFVSFSQVCLNCQYSKKWQSQPVKGSTPVGNLQLSAAVYFTGGSFTKMEKICKALGLQIHQYDTFRRHARMFLEPAIYHKWKMDQHNLFDELRPHGQIPVGGDMRADSPGHSAKFGSYTLMHLDGNKILDVQLVQSNEVGGSVYMEKEGLKRGLDLLESNNLEVDYIVTDRHTQVQKYLRERQVLQYYDVWHFEKGLSKKLDKVARNKECQVLRKWLPSIKNLMYWTATSSTTGPEKLAKWNSIINHLQNVHVHEDPLFPKCVHPVRVSRDPNKWFPPGSMALYKVEKLLTNKRVLRDVEKLSHNQQTSALEAFHSVILRFAPKNVVFPFIGMLCRLYLAAMHFNENAGRQQAKTLKGKAVFKVVYPKSKKGQAAAKPVKTKPTFGYVSALMRLVFTEVFPDPATFVEELKKVPVPEDLSAQYERPSKEEVIARHVSRFSQGPAGTQCSSPPHQETPGVSDQQHTTG